MQIWRVSSSADPHICLFPPLGDTGCSSDHFISTPHHGAVLLGGSKLGNNRVRINVPSCGAHIGGNPQRGC